MLMSIFEIVIDVVFARVFFINGTSFSKFNFHYFRKRQVIYVFFTHFINAATDIMIIIKGERNIDCFT